MTKYIKAQIIKHALQHYIQRDGASEKDIKQEKRVLEEQKQYVKRLKRRYGIGEED